MIVDVPSCDGLSETGLGWLNLAWEGAIESLSAFSELREYYEEHLDQKIEPEKQQAFWKAQRFKINNSITLHQQALELLLKARIAQIDPFLLIATDWTKAKTSAKGEVSFLDLPTIPAGQLCRAIAIVESAPLPSDFISHFDEMRKERNKIVHLHADTMQAEVTRVLSDVLKSYSLLFPESNWLSCRRSYIEAHEAPLLQPWEDSFADYNLVHELELVVDALDRATLTTYFSFEKKKKRFRCPECESRLPRHYSDVVELAQMQPNGSIRCIACGTSYTVQEHSDLCED